ncbi:MAG: hypothetical protein QG635_1732 [Bacteroidota bacterium]|nr:hypothetical protein [Bacteroidota bacterium]
MVIERNSEEVIIKIPSSVNTEGIERIIDIIAYREATANSKAKQDEIDIFVKDFRKDWWLNNKARFIK